MLLCSVTDVFFETVLRKFLRCGDHVSVSFHFCNYACRRNGITQCIAVDKAVLHGGNIKVFNGINKNVAAHVIARAMRQSIPVSFGKRLFCCLKNIYLINFLLKHPSCAESCRSACNKQVKLFHALLCKLFGIVHALDHKPRGKDHACGNNGARKRSAPDFVHSRNGNSAFPGRAFVLSHLFKPFGLVNLFHCLYRFAPLAVVRNYPWGFQEQRRQFCPHDTHQELFLRRVPYQKLRPKE